MVTKPRTRRLPSTTATAPEPFLDGYLPYLLGVASYVMNRDFHDDVKAAGLSPLEWRTLATLTDRGGDGITVGELCRKVVSLQPAQTKAIKRLDDAGLVLREDDADDLRKTRVHITPRGRAIAARLMRTAKEHENRMLRDLSATQIAALRTALAQIVSRSHNGPSHKADEPSSSESLPTESLPTSRDDPQTVE